jgi:muramoyltetrapeptide carboxypeptidase
VPRARLQAALPLLAARYRVRVADDITRADGFLAGDDDRRAEELDGYLRDPEVRAVLVARGGYGLLRILDRLDPGPLRRDPKLLVGFSDATALLGWALQAAGVRGIHGPVVAQLGELPAADVDWMFRLMESTTPAGPLAPRLAPVGAPAAGPVEGPLLGGNLCLLAHLVGTPFEVRVPGAVLLVEEVGERPYAIDRYLTRLGLAGALDQVAGALVGDLTRCDESTMAARPDAAEVIDERLRRYRIPGLAGLPVGHGAANLALPFGGRCALDFAAGRLELLEAAVA